MTNTSENHAKLAALLATDAGWSLGSPTHWLLLTTGARLALAVDKFDRDFVTGHNPIYGACKIPMAQVYIIRTSASGANGHDPFARRLAAWSTPRARPARGRWRELSLLGEGRRHL